MMKEDKKINKVVHDLETNTVSIVMDKETYKEYEEKRKDRTYEKGFDFALYYVDRYLEKINKIEDISKKGFADSCGSTCWTDDCEGSYFYIDTIKEQLKRITKPKEVNQ